MNENGNFSGGALPGVGDVSINPYFVADGYWDSNDIWVDGDYHLKSEAGRWDSNSQTWVQDDVTSPCIDAGNPDSEWTGELWPHGKRINMGAYGGTPQASMSPWDSGNRADLNNDGVVDFGDFTILGYNYWIAEVLLSEDLNRDGVIDVLDVRIFVDAWLWQQ